MSYEDLKGVSKKCIAIKVVAMDIQRGPRKQEANRSEVGSRRVVGHHCATTNHCTVHNKSNIAKAQAVWKLYHEIIK